MVTTAKAIGYAIAPEGMLRRGETRAGEVRPTQKKHVPNGYPAKGGPTKTHLKNGLVPPHMVTSKPPAANSFLPVWFLDVVDLMCDLRGIEWDFGQGVYVANETRPLERTVFLRAVLISFIRHYLTLDLFEFCFKSFPGVGSTQGASIFYPNLPPLQRFAVATFLHILTGASLIEGFGLCYDLCTLIGVGFFRNEPTSWPPILDNPWISDSMHSFWSRRWHQFFRHAFLIYGGYPGHKIGGNLGMIFGTFLASGLYHEFGMYNMGRGFEWNIPLIFLLQAPLLISERIFLRLTGRRVGGLFGTIWVYFCIMVLAQPLCAFSSLSLLFFFFLFLFFVDIWDPQQIRGIAEDSQECRFSHRP